MRLLFLGDVVGRSGRQIVSEHLPRLVEEAAIDFVVVNGENAAGGFGITEEIAQELLDAGADAITTGNHVWDQREALVFIERQPRLLRPANFPSGAPGRGANVVTARNGARVLVANVMGRVFMDAMDDPFASIERILDGAPLGTAVDAVVVDVHAEATSEKQALAYFCDGRASLVVGTHTHVPTADHRILPEGTAFVSDVGNVRRLRIDHRHGARRAARPLHAQDPRRPLLAGAGRCDPVRRRRRARRPHRPGDGDRPPPPRRRAGAHPPALLGLKARPPARAAGTASPGIIWCTVGRRP